MGVPLTDVFDTLQVYLARFYVNDFNRFGRTWQVNVQADAPFRTRRGDRQAAQGAQRRRRHGAAGGGGRVRDSAGPVQITRYNMYPTASINGLPLPGVSSGDAIGSMEKLAKDLPRKMATEWTEVSYLQKQASKLEQFRDLRNIPSRLAVVVAGPGAGRPVRELVAAAGGDPRRADVPARALGGLALAGWT